jgi:hypothetical protein
MRAVSLTNNQVISLLNRYFVNVFVSNEDYADKGSASADEKAQLRRIFNEGYAAKLPVGTVHAYVLKPDGHLLISQNVVQAARGAPLIEMLEKVVKTLDAHPGEPVVKPAPAPPPQVAPGEVQLHVVARYLERQGDKLVISGQGEHRGNWSDNPGEDWIALDRAQWSGFEPKGAFRVGEKWTVAHEIAALIWNRLYPPAENNDLATNRIDSEALSATVASVERGVAHIRLEGSLKMKHPFYHKDDAYFVNAAVVGFVDADTRTRRIESLQLVTDQATYGAERPMPFGAAVELVTERPWRLTRPAQSLYDGEASRSCCRCRPSWKIHPSLTVLVSAVTPTPALSTRHP